jgi:hypothetical protein
MLQVTLQELKLLGKEDKGLHSYNSLCQPMQSLLLCQVHHRGDVRLRHLENSPRPRQIQTIRELLDLPIHKVTSNITYLKMDDSEGSNTIWNIHIFSKCFCDHT